MSNPVITVNRFECLKAECTWTDENGTALDLTGKTITLVDYSPAELVGATVTITDAVNGKFEIEASQAIVDGLPSGLLSYFRLSLNTAGSCSDSTPRIGINVE